MNAEELADYILISKHHASICGIETAEMLRQQAKEIAQLKIANQDLKYQLIQKSGEQV